MNRQEYKHKKYNRDMEDKIRSDFETYRDLMSEKNFLQVQARANNIGAVTPLSADPLSNEIHYSVPSESNSGSYDVGIIIDDLNKIDTTQMSPKDINALIRGSQLHVNCTCPSYTYWGFKYIGTRDDYAIESETRRPDVRNPDLRGNICKHIYRTLQVYPFYTNTIRQALVG